MLTVPALHPAAVALTAVRLVGDDTLRGYTIAEPEGGWPQLERMVRMASVLGYLRPPGRPEDSYAVLDVLDENNDIVQDYMIPHARAWRWWYRKLGLRVAPDERS